MLWSYLVFALLNSLRICFTVILIVIDGQLDCAAEMFFVIDIDEKAALFLSDHVLRLVVLSGTVFLHHLQTIQEFLLSIHLRNTDN